MENWYTVENVDEVDSPSLLIYPARVRENIRIFKSFVSDISRLRPHVKTNKSPEVSRMFVEEGITKFKCATIAEAEMLAMNGATDVLLAHQPVGPKGKRLAQLVQKYPGVHFSCIVDDASLIKHLSRLFDIHGLKLDVYIDVNVGMNRTGIEPEKVMDLLAQIKDLKDIRVVGLHAYDGHLRDPDLAVRTRMSDEGFNRVKKLQEEILATHGKKMIIVAGGTPSFPVHARRPEVECSPGTFIYWDKGYQQMLGEQPFHFAALVLTRVISIPTEKTLCVDLGHKAIASENPLANRVTFINAAGLTPIGHSEEHLVLQTEHPHSFQVGDVLYGVPYHICPTVALHDAPYVVEHGKCVGTWETLSRKRKIHI